MRGRRSLALVLALSTLLLSTGAVAAQSVPTGGNSTGTGSTPTASTPTGERIDNSTVLVDSSFDSETGMVSVTLRSETLQEVTLSDAGAVVEGGEVNQRSVSLAPGETTTVSLDVTETDNGFVGVTVATDDTLYAVPVESGSTGSSGSPIPERDDALALVVGISLVPIATLLLHKRRKRKRSQSARRVDGV